MTALPPGRRQLGIEPAMDGIPTKREAGKNARRQHIIDAAEFLIKQTGATDFSMRDLAIQAGLSTYTTYNLIGSKATVFYILLNQCLDRISFGRLLGKPEGDPFDYIFFAGDTAVDVFTSEPEFYCALMRYVFGVPDAVNRPAFMDRAFRYWRGAVQPLEDAGLLSHDVTPVDLARDLQVFFTGSMEFWVHGELDSDQFRAQIRHGISLRLMALGFSGNRADLAERLSSVRSVIEALTPTATDVEPSRP